MINFLCSLLLVLILVTPALAVDRCRDYITEVRNAHIMYLGVDYPWWYGLSQLKAESRCRNISAFDGGQGIAQFMPVTAKSIGKLMKENVSPNNPEQATRMQAFYMAYIEAKENWTNKLWVSYQIYNGGIKYLKKEYKEAGNIADHDAMRDVCKRAKIKLKGGQILDMCDVNYDYSSKVNSYGLPYKIGNDERIFW